MVENRPLPLLALLAALLTLSACSTVGNNRSWLSAEPYTVATQDASEEAQENEEKEEESDALDGWLQALAYRSPNYGFELPQRENRLREALKTAFELQGTPYRLGGTDAQGLDCSGLVWVAFASAGIKLPRTSQEQFHATERIARDALRAGDLVFFKTGRNKKRSVDHVGIYIGNGQFLHAPRRGKAVTVASMDEAYWTNRFVGAGRVPGVTPESVLRNATAEATIAESADHTQPTTESKPAPAKMTTANTKGNTTAKAAAKTAANTTAKTTARKVSQAQRPQAGKAVATASKKKVAQKDTAVRTETSQASKKDGVRNAKTLATSGKPPTDRPVKRTQTNHKKREAALATTDASR